MEFDKSVIELIKMRRSSRTYIERDIDDIIVQKLNDYIFKINEETKIKARFIFTNNNCKDGKEIKKLGTYGVISGADSFIVGILNKSEKNVVEFGYLFEKILLYVTNLGLQTCWLGGTFNKNDFTQNAGLLEDEFIPIVSPVGYAKDKPRTFETAMRIIAGSNKRKTWSELFFEDNISTPLNEQSAGSYAVPLEMVRLGPSASNKQPWRIIKNKNEFHFFLSRTKGYGVTFYDIQKNDIGIAKCHFELSTKELGFKGKWQEVKYDNKPGDWEYICTWSAEL